MSGRGSGNFDGFCVKSSHLELSLSVFQNSHEQKLSNGQVHRASAAGMTVGREKLHDPLRPYRPQARGLTFRARRLGQFHSSHERNQGGTHHVIGGREIIVRPLDEPRRH